jgi:hypothetical protein
LLIVAAQRQSCCSQKLERRNYEKQWCRLQFGEEFFPSMMAWTSTNIKNYYRQNWQQISSNPWFKSRVFSFIVLKQSNSLQLDLDIHDHLGKQKSIRRNIVRLNDSEISTHELLMTWLPWTNRPRKEFVWHLRGGALLRTHQDE